MSWYTARLQEAKHDPQEFAQRQQSDFLADTNHEGEITDFHSFRHTCGAWLAMTGAHPKIVQQVMRHESITLTMDTYGHLFPGQEADAVSQMRGMLNYASNGVLKATGTDDNCQMATQDAQHQAQQLGRETVRAGCDNVRDGNDQPAQKESPKPLQIADLSDVVRRDAISSGGGTRTPDTRIMIPLL